MNRKYARTSGQFLFYADFWLNAEAIIHDRQYKGVFTDRLLLPLIMRISGRNNIFISDRCWVFIGILCLLIECYVSLRSLDVPSRKQAVILMCFFLNCEILRKNRALPPKFREPNKTGSFV